MENPPPGYNPNVSLLSGGTGTILPVQGGGGGDVPANYNPNQSLLEGGTGTIQAIRGGGDAKVSFKNEKTKGPLEEIKEVPKISKENIETSGENTLELYTLEKGNREAPTALKNEERIEKTEDYVRERVNLVYYDDLDSMGTPKVYKPLTYQICFQDGFEFEKQPQKIVLEKIKDPLVLLVPNIKGDLQRFLSIKEFLETKNFLKKRNHFIIFAGEFFSDNQEQDHLLLDEYVRLAEKNNLYNLFTRDENAKKHLCSYMNKEKDSIIPFFLDPNVLLFEDLQLILTVDALPPNMMKFISKSPNEKSFYIPPAVVVSEAAGGKPFKSYLEVKGQNVVAVNTPMIDSMIPKESSIQCPPDEYKCSEFQGGYSLSKLGNPLSILEPQEDLYLFYKNQNQLHLPFFREEKEKEKKDRAMTQRQIRAQAEANAAAATAAAPAPAPPLEPGPFQESSAAKDATNLFSFSIELKTYKIRFATDEVKKNWKELIFVQEEADFLNGLHLSPKLLQDVFQDEWKDKLVSFLESLVDSKCYNDTNLLMNEKCKDARAFLQSVYMQMYANTLDDLYKQWGSQSPLKDKQSILDGILQKMSKVNLSKKSAIADKLEEIKLSDEAMLISKEDFRGDPSGRYLDIHVNTHEPNLPWFMNYIEKEKNAAGKETQFYKRLYGKNPEDVLEKYRKVKQGIAAAPSVAPVAPAAPVVEAEAPVAPVAEAEAPATTVAAPAAAFKSKLPSKTFSNFKKQSERLDHLDSLLSEMEDYVEGKPPPKPIAQQMKNRLSLTRKRITNRLALSKERIGNRLSEIQDRLSKISLLKRKKGGNQTKYRLTRKRFIHKI